MLKASVKDIFRTIGKEKKRFFSIMIITILGVTMMTGLQAGCEDLRLSADRFYDEQRLFDISIMSTLGLTEEDVDVIAAMEGVEWAEGSYSEVVHTKKGMVNKTAEIKIFQKEGLNIPYLVEGKLPQVSNEIAVTASYLADTGKKIGDWLEIEEIISEKDTQEEEELLTEEESFNFTITRFQIVGTMIDVMDINNAEGSAAFRATPNADYTFFVLPQALEIEAYSAVYVTLEGLDKIDCYSFEYEKISQDMIEKIEAEIMRQREQARYHQVTQEAYEKIEEKEEEMKEEFAKAEKELADAEEELKEGKEELFNARKELSDGKKELEEKEKETFEEIADAKEELADAYEKLNQGWGELNEAEKQLNISQAQLEEAKQLLREKEKEARQQLEEAEANLQQKIKENQKKTEEITQAKEGIKQALEVSPSPWSDSLEAAWNAYVEQTRRIVTATMAPFMTSQEEDQSKIQAAITAALQEAAGNPDTGYGNTSYLLMTELSANPVLSQMVTSGAIPGMGQTSDLLTIATGQATCYATASLLEKAEETLEEQKEYAEKEIAGGWAKLQEGERQLEEGREQLSAGRGEVIENYQKYQDGVKELEENEVKAMQEFADARQDLIKGEADLREGEEELAQGEKELEDHKQEYLEEKVDAEEKIAEAKTEVRKIDMTKWYVQDRYSLSGYTNVKSDTGAIESLATVFAVVFFVVAILISLTSVTRMVEEERGLIGTYKALGYYDSEISRKYLIYTFAAGGIGAILGDVGGYVVLPEILFIFFRVMYLFPEYILHFDIFWGILAGALFLLGVMGAAAAACYSELKYLPSYLMRPKSPRAGTRVFLEYITPLWKRMSFLNKVTARNLFRYKKRMFMTLFGIAGCTALLVFGLAIKDSVSELMPLQYEKVYQYDLLAVAGGEDNEKLLDYVDNRPEIEKYINLQIESVKIKNQRKDTEKVQLMIFENTEDFLPYFSLLDDSKVPIMSLEKGIYVTENAAKILDLKEKDKLLLQKLDLTQKEVEIVSLVKNYLGNNIYMSKETYEELFGSYEPNGILAKLSAKCQDPIAFSDELAKENWILSSVSTQELKDGFSAAFTLINLVVYVVLVLAASLAFVVLFTLASINISERERELATIKVLGFFDKEVHSYVNKETMILTIIGILIGLPAGAALSGTLTELLKMPSIYFAVTIYSRSYWICGAIALVFALIVQLLTNRSLNVIDPVEALKSVE